MKILMFASSLGRQWLNKSNVKILLACQEKWGWQFFVEKVHILEEDDQWEQKLHFKLSQVSLATDTQEKNCPYITNLKLSNLELRAREL